MEKSLDRKLAAIHADPGCREFIIADAKDADMALGIGAPGASPEMHAGRGPVQDARRISRSDAADHAVGPGRHHADVGQLEPSRSTFRERLFDNSPVTPAVRANDTTDIHLARGATITSSRRGRSAPPASITSSAATSTALPHERTIGANLGLYSVTFNNNLEHDFATLERFHEFREEAERKGFRYFLEVFDPNITGAVAPELLPGYINDMITRMLAGVAPGRAAALPQDGLSRPQGHGRARPVRPAPRRRHPGRLGRHHA